MSARTKPAPVAPAYTASDVLQAAQAAHEAAVNALRVVQCIDAADTLAAAGLDLEANDRATGPATALLRALARAFEMAHLIDYQDDLSARRRAAEALDQAPGSWVRDDAWTALTEESAAASMRLRSIVGPLQNAERAVCKARRALDAAHATGAPEDVQRCYVEGLFEAREAVREAREAAAPRVVLRRATIAEYDAEREARARGERGPCDWRLERQGTVETFASRDEAALRYGKLTGCFYSHEYLCARLPLIAPEVSP